MYRCLLNELYKHNKARKKNYHNLLQYREKVVQVYKILRTLYTAENFHSDNGCFRLNCILQPPFEEFFTSALYSTMPEDNTLLQLLLIHTKTLAVISNQITQTSLSKVACFVHTFLS